MKKSRKGNLLHRMMALLLSAVLTAGTAFGTAPVNVLAQENAGEEYNQAQESVSGNAVTEEETGAESDGEETEAEPAEGESEETEKPVENPMTKVEAAKRAVEDALTNTEVSNNTTQEDLEEVIKAVEDALADTKVLNNTTQEKLEEIIKQKVEEALEEAGIDEEYVAVTVADFEKIFATAKDGSISATVTITIGEEPDAATSTVPVNMTIDKLQNIGWVGSWTLDDDGKLTIESSQGRANFYSWIMNSTNGRELGVFSVELQDGVKHISEYLFRGCANLTSIEMVSVRFIQQYAFQGCSSLTSIELPACNGTIGNQILDGEIGQYAFNGCSSLEDINIPAGYTTIGTCAFQGCSSLTSISIPDSVTSMSDAFKGCSSLESVTMQGTKPPELSDSAFEGCKFVLEGTKGIKVPAGAVDAYIEEWDEWKEYIVGYYSTPEEKVEAAKAAAEEALEEITVSNDTTQENLEEVIKQAVKDALEEADIDEDVVVTVGDFKKTDATVDEAGSISATVTITIGEEPNTATSTVPVNMTIDKISISIIYSGEGYTFYSNGKLTIESDQGMIWFDDWKRSSSKYDKLAIISVELQDGVTYITEKLFDGCANLTSIEIADSVRFIHNYVFQDCISLTSIEIPAADGSIGNYAFNGCSNLKDINIPAGYKSIGVYAFKDCISLTSISIPDSVTSMGYAFTGCSSLESVTMQGTKPPSLGSDTFDGCKFVTDGIKGIKVPAGAVDVYKEAYLWDKWKDYIVGYYSTPEEKVEAAKAAAEEALKEITVSNDTTQEELEKVIKQAVDAALEEAGIDEDVVVTVGGFEKNNATGAGAGSITAEVTITIGEEPDTATRTVPVNMTIDKLPDIASGYDWTLDADGKLTIKSDTGMQVWCSQSKYSDQVISVEIKEGVTVIRASAFRECSALTDIKIPDSVTSIEAWAFYGCSSLTSIVLPPNMTSIENRLFHGCSKLEEITIPDGVTSIEEGAFEGCSALESITIPDSVTGIGERAFWQCSSLTSVTLPDTITNIGDFSFSGCKLEEITIPDGVTDIGQGAFYQCLGLVSVTMKGSIPPTLVDHVFTQCKFVTENMKGIKVPEGTADAYKTAWAEWADYIGGYSTPATPAEKVDAAKKAVEEALEEITLSNATTEDRLQEAIEKAVNDALEKAGMDSSDVTVSVEDFTKKNATVDAEGSISAKVTITSGEGTDEVTETVEVDQTINKLPGTPAEKVEAAKQAAEDALKEITVSNDTTKDSLQEDIEEAVKTALEEAGVDIEDITVTVKDFTSTPATAGTEGNISATVEITSGEGTDTATGTVTVDKTIDKLPATPADKVEAAKKAVEEALEEITLSNATTEDRLQEAIEKAVNDALEKAGMDSSDVTVSVEDFTKKNATVDEEGSISATVTITSGAGTDKVTETVEVDQSIKRLPGTPAEKVEAAKQAAEEALKEITVSNDTTKESLQEDIEEAVKTALEEAGVDIEDITVTVKDFTSTPATVGTEGNISATVEITSGKGTETATGTVTVDKTIDKLPATPADKVEAARKAVEEALEEITASNATTQERLQRDIEKAVKNALEKAGMDSSDVTVSVEDFTKTDATLDDTGSIRAKVTITSGEGTGKVTETVMVDQTIKKLPGTPEEKVSAVKQAVEDALWDAIEEMLAGTEVTNENAGEIANRITDLMEDAVTEALEVSGVSMDDVGFGVIDVNADDLATVDKEGSIRVAIPVISTENGDVSAAAEVLVPIAKPDKDEVWANEVVEGALTEDITITNETTQEEILDVIKEALGDEATVEGIEQFEKVEATQDAPGKLSLKIKLTINGKTVYITVNVPIAQLTSREGVYIRFLDYDSMGEDSIPCYKYTGTAIKPAIEVYNNETLLTEGSDYTIVYKENVKAGGNSRLYIKGKGSFKGRSRMVNFTIINADIDQDTDHPTKMTVVANTKVAPVIMDGTRKLTAKDYKLEGDGLKNGKYKDTTAEGAPNILTVTGIGGYAGSSFEIEVTVIAKSAAKKLAVSVDNNFKPVYDGSKLNLSALFKQTQDGEGAITVTDSKEKTKILKEGIDFNVICTSSLTNAGTVKFTLTGMGEYTGNVSKTFKISPLKVTDSAKFSVTFDENKDYEYKASGASVDNLVVKYLGETDSDTDDKILIPGVDYKVTYSNHKKVSTNKDASFKITFLGNYKGSSAVSKTFKVVTAKLSAANTAVTVPDKVYGKANKAYKSTPIVTVNGATIKASNYTVSYAWATESEAGDDTKYVSDNKVKITIADGDTYAKVKVTVTPKGSYGLADGAVIEGEYYVRSKPEGTFDLSKATVTFSDKEGKTRTSLEYNGRPFFTPEGNNPEADDAPDSANAVYVRVRIGAQVVDPSLYDVVWTNATAKGKATVVIRGKGAATEKGMAVGSKNKTINIKVMSLQYQTLKIYVENVINSLKNIFPLIK